MRNQVRQRQAIDEHDATPVASCAVSKAARGPSADRAAPSAQGALVELMQSGPRTTAQRQAMARWLAPADADVDTGRSAATRADAGAGADMRAQADTAPGAHGPSAQVAQRRAEAAADDRAAPGAMPLSTAVAAPAGDSSTRAAAPNRTGLPDALKFGVETLSGLRLDHVRVHYDSARPAQLSALAYAQGHEIHVAPGQEQHLPHEAWHLVQQAQGRVRPTLQAPAGVPVNDDPGLEREADAMGARAAAAGAQRVAADSAPPGAAAVALAGAAPAGAAPIAQRRIDFVGAGLEPQPRHLDVKPQVRAAITRLEADMDDKDRVAFRSAFGVDPGDLSLGRRLIELIHDDIEHGEFDLDNPQHVMALFHEILRLERHGVEAWEFGLELAKAFTRGGPALGEPPASEEEHGRVIAFARGAFNGMAVRDVVLSLGLRPIGASDAGTRGATLELTDPGQLRKLYAAVLGRERGQQALKAAGPAAGSGVRAEKVWDTVYLGTGAAVAYHMMSNRVGSNPLETLVLGKAQPWQPGSAGDRAFRSVNHPPGWVSPKRDKARTPDEFADTGAFSGEITEVIRAHSVLQVDALLQTGGIRKSEAGAFYEIRTDKGVYRARHVISALGIGRHKPPIDMAEFDRRGAAGDNARVLDMDEFHRQLGDEHSELNRVKRLRAGAFKIALAGPNAGVDVAYSATNHGIPVLWFAASKPAWVKGFANYGIQADKLKVALAYFDSYEAVREHDVVTGVTVTAGQDRYTLPVAALLAAAGVTVVRDIPKEAYDYLVYAVGPDESASGVLAPALGDALKAPAADMPDRDHRFTAPGFVAPEGASAASAEGQRAAWAGLQVTGDGFEDKLKLALARWYKEAAVTPRVEEAFGRMAGLLDGLRPVAAVPPKATLNLRLAHADGSSVEVIGAQAPRLSAAKSKEMEPVVDSLGPTVVGNDQLTPSRARAEASAGIVPRYVGKKAGGIDLATDDQVVVAAHIALAHDLPPLLADYVTRRIIEERVGVKDAVALGGYLPDSGLRPDPHVPDSFGRTFNERWTGKMQALEKALARA